MSEILILGEALIDIFAAPGTRLRDADTLRPRPGGAPANVAVALARLGADVGFIGKVGTDDYGGYLRELLAAEGVDVTYFTADRRAPTMVAIVAVPSATEQHFVLHSGASVLLTPADLPRQVIEASLLFNFGSVTLSGAAAPALMRAIEWARSAGTIVLFDVNLRPALWPDLELARQRIEVCLPMTTVLKVNENELSFLTETTDPERGSKLLLTQGIELCCVSLGDEGVFFRSQSAAGYVPALSVEVQDSTGCGDAFVAGIAYQLTRRGNQTIAALSESELIEICTFANACGALAATQIGGMSASPDLGRVEDFLRITKTP